MPDFLSIDSASIEEQFPVWFRLYSASEASHGVMHSSVLWFQCQTTALTALSGEQHFR
jgi:hypothetical protein